MGLLDDAIREHLDLKRRRGADPDEIERAEREALGPVRRAPEDLEPGSESEFEAGVPLSPAPDADEAGEYEESADEGWSDSFEDETELFGEEPSPAFGHVPPGEPAEFDEPDHEEMATRQHSPVSEPLDPGPPEPAPPAAPPEADPDVPRTRERHGGGETAEYDVEQELDKGADDVLEETPEFLQDTPDHDRLWFEQRPPRDFDFDG